MPFPASVGFSIRDPSNFKLRADFKETDMKIHLQIQIQFKAITRPSTKDDAIAVTANQRPAANHASILSKSSKVSSFGASRNIAKRE